MFLGCVAASSTRMESELMIGLQVTAKQQTQDSTGQSALNVCQSCSASLQRVANRVQELLEDGSNPQVNYHACPVVLCTGQD